MRKLVVILLIIFFPITSWGEEKERSDSFEYFQFEIKEWISQGDSDWLKSFMFAGYKIESELEFEDIDAPITIFTAKGKPGLYWLTLQGSLGFGKIDSGKSTDTDLIDGWLISESEADLDGDIFMADTTLFLRLFPWEEKSSSYLDGFIGFSYYREKLNMTNGVQTKNSWILPTPLGPFQGLNSTYEFRWTSLPVGLKGNLVLNKEVAPGLYSISLVGSAAFGYSSYRGEGTWNLRTDWKQNPSFKHEATGSVFLFNSGLIYQPIKHISIGAGYQLQRYRAKDGTETIFFANGREVKTSLDEVNSTRHGPYVLISGQF